MDPDILTQLVAAIEAPAKSSERRDALAVLKEIREDSRDWVQLEGNENGE